VRAQEFANTKLVIFDIDDTLVNTDTKVGVVRDGRVVRQLNSHDFTHYQLRPGESFDFGAFRDAREFFDNAKPIAPMIAQLKHDIATGNKVIMVTARADFDDRDVFLDTFKKYGVDMDRVHVYRAGNIGLKVPTEEKKKMIIRRVMGQDHYDKVIMYDDAEPNLQAFMSLAPEYPWSRFYAWHVDRGGRATEYHRSNLKEATGSSAAGVVLYAEDTGRWGFQQRSDTVNDPGLWAAWGGGREPGESTEQCALRELAEESGYRGPIKLEALDENPKFMTFVGRVPAEFEPRYNPEWKDYCWVKAGDWPQPMHPGMAVALENIDTESMVPESQTAKTGIMQTDVYGSRAYHARCLEPGCDWESRRYDRIQQAQAAAKKHAETHFDKKAVAEGLDEAVGGNYLYHATSADGLKGMLSSGSIRSATGPQAATQAQTKLPTVSVTRDWGYASGTHAQSQMSGIGRDAILVLDRNAVESNFKTLGTSQNTNIRGLAFNPYLRKDGEARPQNTDPMARANAKAKAKYAEPTAKAGGEFEEAVVVPKGALPLKGTMVGFWINPKSELMKDPAIMNDPRRLDMVRPNQFVKAKQEQGVAEAFDQPYKLKWEKSDYGDVDALAKLQDGTSLSIMFNLADKLENNWGVEFYRNNSQAATGEGDAQRVFATVLAAIGQFIKKKKPNSLFFTAVKEEDPTGSRAKLYDRLVQRYATGLGYDLKKVDYPEQTGYKLTRKEQGMAENFADGRNPGRKGLAKRVGVNTKASISSLRKTAKNSSGEKQRMAHWLANMKAGKAKAKRK
jgi:8-oxo-dGTP pyrophosphatase MutT (NUDIX family)